MAGITATSLILFDNWPTPVVPMAVPKDGFDGTDHTDVTTAAYTLGTKCCVYDETSGGWSTFIYLKNVGATATAVGTIVGPNTTKLVEVSTDPTAIDGADITLLCGMCAVAVAVLAQNDYGWFWCGGHVVQDDKYGCDALAATSITSDGSVADGELLMLLDLGPGLQFDTWTGDMVPCGVALAADA